MRLNFSGPNYLVDFWYFVKLLVTQFLQYSVIKRLQAIVMAAQIF